MKAALVAVIALGVGLFAVRAMAQASPSSATSSLQAQIDANNAEIASLSQQIAQYQVKLQQIGADKKTLQAAINALDLQRSKVQAQVAITQKQIGITQLQIQQLGGQINEAQQQIETSQSALGAYLLAVEKGEHQSLMLQLLASHDITDAWSDLNANLQMQESVQNQMQALRLQESTLSDSRSASQTRQATLAAQQQALAQQQVSLAATVASKNQLLADTKAQESNYQKLLAAAQSELDSFSAFAQNAGGSGLLGTQTVCDSWGCYYNQRDSAWGNMPLDGTKFRLASDGCLVASMAMVMTHYGYRDVTPVTINSNPDNFASYYPAFLLSTITVDGVTATRTTAAIDATLSTGNPVVVGLHAYGGTHFVVLVSGSRGNYLMRDPYIANGKDISFSAHYTIRSIYAVSRVTISS